MKPLRRLAIALLFSLFAVQAQADQAGFILSDEYNHDPFASLADLVYWRANPWTNPRPNYYSMPVKDGPSIWQNINLHNNGNVTSVGHPPFFYGASIADDFHVLNHYLVPAGAETALELTGNWVMSSQSVCSLGPVSVMIHATPENVTTLGRYEGKRALAATYKRESENLLAMVADPVDTTTGDFVFSHPLIAVDAPFPLVFTLHSTSLFEYDYRPLGKNAWSDYEVSFNRYSADAVQIRFNRWRVASFRRNSTTGQYESIASGWNNWRVWDSVPGSVCAYDPSSGTLYVFDEASGKLAALTHGAKSAYMTYSGDNLHRVTDTNSGRYLEFGYSHPTNGRLITSITDGARTATISYDSNECASVLTDASGVVYTLNITDGATDSIVNSGNTVLSNTYDIIGRAATQTDGEGNLSTFSYGPFSGGLSKRTHKFPDGSEEEIYINPQYRVAKTVSEMNRQTFLGYDSAGNQALVIDPRGKWWQTSYYTSGDVAISEDPLGFTTEYTRNGFGLPLAIEDEAGKVTSFTYDLSLQVASMTTPCGDSTTYDYDLDGMLAKTTLPRGGEFTFTNTGGNVTSIEDPLGNIRSFEFAPFTGLLTKSIDAAGNETLYERDGGGKVTKLTNDNGDFATFTFDNRGDLASSTDFAGNTTTLTRDGNGRVTGITNPAGKTTTFEFNPRGLLKKTTDPTGVPVSRFYNGDGLLTTIQTLGLGALTFQHDLAGNVTRTITPSGFTDFTFDDRNLLTKRKDNLNYEWTFAHDPRGLVNESRNPLGQKTELSHDDNGRVVSVKDPSALIASQTFDADGNLASITNPRGKTTSYTFDLAGNLTKETTHGGRETTVAYNSRNLPEVITDPMLRTTTVAYDNLSAVSSVADDVGTIVYTRDALSRPLTIVEGSKSGQYVYNSLGQITQYTDPHGYVITYTYDDAGRLKTHTYGGKTITYTYTTYGLLSQVKDWTTRNKLFFYNASGQVSSASLPLIGVGELRNYDARGLPSLIRYFKGATTYWQQTIGYDGMERITSDTVVTSSGTSARTFAYDTSSRLVQAIYPGAATWSVSSYDAASNINGLSTLITGPGAPLLSSGSTSFTFDGDNRLESVNGGLLLNDDAGNLVYGPLGPALLPNWALTWDARNRLVQASTSTYEHDSENRRIKKTESGTTWQKYVWCPVTNQMVMSEDQTGARKYYIYGNGLAWCVAVSPLGVETPEYYHADVRGSTVAVTNSTGALLGKVTYGPYGEIAQKDAAVTTPFLYLGKSGVMTDPNGLVYMRSRYYHPGLRRFLSRDVLSGSIADSRTLNQYAYANCDPINNIDPNGTWASGAINTLPGGLAALMALDTVDTYFGFAVMHDGNWGEAGMSTVNPANMMMRGWYEGYDGIGMDPGNRGQTLTLDGRFMGGVKFVIGAFGTVTAGGPGVALSRGTSWFTRIFAVRAEVQVAKTAVEKPAMLALPEPKFIQHHIFNKFRGSSPGSQVYRDFFKQHGVEVDKYTVRLTENMHKNFIHRGGNNWTTRWKQWIDENPNASTEQVYQFGGRLMDDYGINNLPIVPYR